MYTGHKKSGLYPSLVRPLLEYCAPVWDPYTSDLIQQLEAGQRRAICFVKDYNRKSSVTMLQQGLQWSMLAHRRKIQRLTVFHKAVES